MQHSDGVDTVVASACLLRKPVLGEVAFDSTDLLDLLNDVAGDVDCSGAQNFDAERGRGHGERGRGKRVKTRPAAAYATTRPKRRTSHRNGGLMRAAD